ncbi:hypothetical protein EG347_13325 [Chryseobacterium sp. G0186]|uniref:hypothetical protein n=1 Tax=Chryseobacterium sp. G0186 TaxID=2487064 RepID=UPI000F4D8356|nr:hypothetical protein [Chryseobacterium sp. G0186]AZA78424.1 hypothetical protein EG347_13325 [Chryseobacterium sp. G0186]
MKNYKIILLLLLTMMGQHLTAQTEVKKPKEVFELFFGSFLANDEATRVKLNDYLRPTVEGKDAFQVDFKENSENMVKSSAEAFLSIFPKAAASACKKEAEDYFEVVFANFKNGKLNIKNVKVVPNEYVEDQKIAEVTYTVSFQVPANPAPEPTVDPKKIKADELKKYLVQLIQDFKNADKTVTIDQEFSLYELKEGDKIYYWNGSPDEIVTNLTDFYFDSF